MHSFIRDLESAHLRTDAAASNIESTNNQSGLDKGPVLRGSVIAESEQDLAELLSRYQQGYYRPNEASVSLLSETADCSKLSRMVVSQAVNIRDGIREEEKKGGSMMQLEHVVKARLLVRHPTQSNSPCGLNNGNSTYRDSSSYYQSSLKPSGWPLSFSQVINPERNRSHNTFLPFQPDINRGYATEYHWMRGSSMNQMELGGYNSLSSYGMDDWDMNSGQSTTNLFSGGGGHDPYSLRGIQQGWMGPYSSNSFYGHQMNPFHDITTPSSPSSVVISRNLGYPSSAATNPYHCMIPTPFFKKSRPLCCDHVQKNEGLFPQSYVFEQQNRREMNSAQDSTRSSQDKLTSFSGLATEDSGLEFIDQFISPRTSSPTSTSEKSNHRKPKGRPGRKPTRRTQRSVKKVSEESENSSGKKEEIWLMDKLTSFSPSMDNCLVYNTQPSESLLLHSNNNYFADNLYLRNSSYDDNAENEEIIHLLEKVGFASDKAGQGTSLQDDFSEHLSKSRISKLSKEDVLELAFCSLGKTSASVDELQEVCKQWVVSLTADVSLEEATKFQQLPSLDSWSGLKHAQAFSRGIRGQRSIELSLKKDKRFIPQRNNLWSCISTDFHQQEFSLGVYKNSQVNRRTGKAASYKRKKNDSILKSCSEFEDYSVPKPKFRKL